MERERRMEFYTVLIGIVVAILVSSFLKICYHFHLKKEKRQYEKDLMSFDLLGQKASYKKYKKISQRKSVSNNPIRQTGDFLDFLISVDNTASKNQNYVENTISKASCGEYADE